MIPPVERTFVALEGLRCVTHFQWAERIWLIVVRNMKMTMKITNDPVSMAFAHAERAASSDFSSGVSLFVVRRMDMDS